MGEGEALAQRRAQMVGEFKGRRARTALLAVDDDEIGRHAGFDHGLAERHEFGGLADAELEAHGLAARQFPQLRDEAHHLQRRREGGVFGGRHAILPHGHAAGG